jgi:hypothetical protein
MNRTKPTGAAATQALYCSIEDWMALSSMRLDSVYRALHRGDLTGKKFGRVTRIHVPSGLRYLESLPDFRPRRRTPELGFPSPTFQK